MIRHLGRRLCTSHKNVRLGKSLFAGRYTKKETFRQVSSARIDATIPV